MKILVSNPTGDYWMMTDDHFVGGLYCRSCATFWVMDSQTDLEIIRMARAKGFACAFEYMNRCGCCEHPDWRPILFNKEIDFYDGVSIGQIETCTIDSTGMIIDQ